MAGQRLVLDPSGALYEPRAGALVVADLHLEKGSSFARRGMMLPPYDTAATLARLTQVVMRLRPRVVIALGDSFHDRDAGERLSTEDATRISALQAGREWIWISGNHDPQISPRVGGERRAEMRLGALTLRHEPSAHDSHGEIAGHLHPVAVIGGRRRAFVTDGTRLVAPAELREQLVALKKEAFNLRFQQATNQLENTARMRAVRRDVARIKTVQAEAGRNG